MLVPLFSGELSSQSESMTIYDRDKFFKGWGEEMNNIAKFDNQIPDAL